MKKILLVEDDPTINQNVKESLIAEGFEVTSVFDGMLAEKFLRKNGFDCIVLDINLPGKNGFDLCRDYRRYNSATPVLILTAFDDLEDKVQGYDCGADDYLTKPFYMKELVLRINSLLRRNLTQKDEAGNSTIVAGDLVINTGTKKVTRSDIEIALTPREYQILVRLVSSRGEVVAKKTLIGEIWGSSFDANTNTIEVFINFLRKKVDKPFGRDSIKTKVGFGYYFDDK
ncbi:MAG TPA: response regulator transcription factor [Cyclobacteriaceae bacterium]|nr:response regulator transcription factor [Cyclobacteriaceae bacterium]